MLLQIISKLTRTCLKFCWAMLGAVKEGETTGTRDAPLEKYHGRPPIITAQVDKASQAAFLWLPCPQGRQLSPAQMSGGGGRTEGTPGLVLPGDRAPSGSPTPCPLPATVGWPPRWLWPGQLRSPSNTSLLTVSLQGGSLLFTPGSTGWA